MKKIICYSLSLIIILILLNNTVFTVDQKYFAIVFQFGEALRVIKNPGLKIKVPFIQKVKFFDNRILNVSSEAKELTALDGKRVIVDAFTKFQIVNPVLFYKTVYNSHGINIRLNKILESSMRKVIGKIPLTILLSSKKSNIMLQILNEVNIEAKNFGINVIDVRILRTDLPKENSTAIYRRMQTAREKEATQIRAEGKEEATRIISKADKESKILLSKAYTKSQIIKGEGDEESAKIYNQSYSIDPEFYKFYRSLETYKNIFNTNKNTFILSSECKMLKYLNLDK